MFNTKTGMSPLQGQLMKRMSTPSLPSERTDLNMGNGNLSVPLPKLRQPIARPRRFVTPHLRTMLQPKIGM